MTEVEPPNPAEVAAAEAWRVLEAHLKDGSSFVFEAGAGAGKTFSLIAALRFILESHSRELVRNNQQVACITFTNVARDMIIAQTDGHPAIYCETTHAFAWLLISGFQKRLCELVPTLKGWQTRLEELQNATDEIEASTNAEAAVDAPRGINAVGYALGRRTVEGRKANLHHDDIFPLFIELMKSAKFRNALTSRFPIILVDEYQDTDAKLIAAIKERFLHEKAAPQFGFFGDHWQKIYGEGCGSIEHPSLKRVDKKANFRSAATIVDCLNRVRPDLTQAPRDPQSVGSVRIFHTNGWTAGSRQTSNHWQGDLPGYAAAAALTWVRNELAANEGWDFGEDTKVLMLTRRALANQLGYSSMPSVFDFNDSYARKANPLIAYFHEHLEPAVRAFQNKRSGEMFQSIDAVRPVMRSPAEKTRWAATMKRVCELRLAGTVGEMISYLQECGLPILNEAVVNLERSLVLAKESGADLRGPLRELEKLHEVKYPEIVALCEYLDGHSAFETKHGVKGEQFQNVLVVFGRGWNEYDFNAYLEMVGDPQRAMRNAAKYEQYRNLFYVTVSRPKKRLALLFTQRLSQSALTTLSMMFQGHPVQDIGTVLNT